MESDVAANVFEGRLNFENHIYVLNLPGFRCTPVFSISMFLFMIICVLSMFDPPESVVIVLLINVLTFTFCKMY